MCIRDRLKGTATLTIVFTHITLDSTSSVHFSVINVTLPLHTWSLVRSTWASSKLLLWYCMIEILLECTDGIYAYFKINLRLFYVYVYCNNCLRSYLLKCITPVSYTHLDVYKRQQISQLLIPKLMLLFESDKIST